MVVKYFLVIGLFILSTSWISAQGSISELDDYIESARKQWEVPGLTVSIVKDGMTLLSKGYGVRSINQPVKIDAETLFMLGSTTKAMTAAAMAMLVDEGKIKWTDKVIDHLPWFRLEDPFITRELTVKDLFTHNSGLGNADLLWVLWDYSTEEIVRRLSKLSASYSLRGGYTYQNIMYATAGLIIEKSSGLEWDEFIHQRIFDPLGMERSCALKSCAFGYENRNKPHYKTKDGIIEIIDSNADSIGAAGSAWSCSSDIIKWMNFVLDSSKVDGKRLISKENFRMLNKPHIIIPDGQFYPTVKFTQPHFTAYSLGWFLHDYKGEYVQFHTGSLNGAGAIVGLVPDQNIGVYISINLDHAEVRHALMYKIFDYLLELGNRDWSTDLLELYGERNEASTFQINKRTQARITGTSPEFLIEDLAGTYSNDYLGTIDIEKLNGKIRMTCRKDRHIELEHWHYNTFIGKIEEYKFDDGSLIDFNLDSQRNISFDLYGYKFLKK